MADMPTEARAMLRQTVRRFLRREIWLWEKRIDPNAFALPSDLAAELAEKVSAMGLSLVREEADTGAGSNAPRLDPEARVDVVEEMSQHRSGVLAPGYGLFGPEVPPALYAADADQTARFLTPLLGGQRRCFLGLHDPWSAGPAPAGTPAAADAVPSETRSGVRIRARRTEDGWMLDGTKLFVAGTGSAEAGADFGVVYARTESASGKGLGVSCFLVETERPGVQRWRPYPTLATGRDTQELNLSNVRLPSENLLGGVGEGLRLAPGAHARRDLFVAAGVVGVGRAAMSIARDRARAAAGVAGRWGLADAHASLAGAAALVRAGAGAAWAVGGSGDCAPEGSGEAAAAGIAGAARARLAALDASARAVDRAIATLGPSGLSADLPLERWFRELRVVRESDGGSRRLRDTTAGYLLSSFGS